MPTDLSRSLLTVLIPGLVALAPWVLALVQHTPATFGFQSYPTLAHALLFAGVVVTGSIFQGLASILEVRWDKRLGHKFMVEADWYAYLASTDTPVAHRYISRLVTSLYFEIAMLQASVVFFVGVAVLGALRFPELACAISISAFIAAALAVAFFWWQGRMTHHALCRTRHELRQSRYRG